MEKKYQLELIGITFNQIESGVYALILQQVGTSRRVPIVIGFPEAQAIQCKLQEVSTPRPLTHDTMVTALDEFGIHIKEVFIKRLPNGVFAADIHLWNGSETKIIDSRSSDAIALAIRVNAPIYTSEEVLAEAGFDHDSEKKDDKVETLSEDIIDTRDLTKLSLDELSEAMMRAADNEDYEEAARIKKEINLRGQKNEDQ